MKFVATMGYLGVDVKQKEKENGTFHFAIVKMANPENGDTLEFFVMGDDMEEVVTPLKENFTMFHMVDCAFEIGSHNGTPRVNLKGVRKPEGKK